MRWWDVLGVCGEVLSVIGFGATLYQVMKTRNATRAVDHALRAHLTEVRREEVVNWSGWSRSAAPTRSPSAC